MFNKVSHEFLYDVSKDAVIRYLNDNGHEIRNLNDITDEMISFLWVNRLHLYASARENGLHDKPVTKFSPGEEKLLECGDIEEDHWEKKIVRGMDDISFDSRAKMYFLLKGCNDDTYFHLDVKYNRRLRAELRAIEKCVFDELIEVHIDEVNFNGCVDDVNKENRYRAGNDFIFYKDELLNRYRFFNKTENSIGWENRYY